MKSRFTAIDKKLQNREKTFRQSNFELLRIIAMLMIVGSHFAAHGVVNTLNLPGGVQTNI